MYSLPKLHRACIKCDDFEHKHVRHSYRFFLRVRDEKGEDLNFAVTDDVRFSPFTCHLGTLTWAPAHSLS